MKQPILSSGLLLVLACCGAYGQLIEPFHGPGGTTDKACIVDDPAFRPSSMQALGRCLAVKEYMRYPSPISPIGDLTLGMMGDEAAFYLYSIMITRPPLTAAQTLTVLDIIHNSFEMPAFIQSHADRKPKTSLALLKMLQATAVDQIVKERIAAETTFLNTLPRNITPIPILNLQSKPGVMPTNEDLPKPKQVAGK